MGLSSAVASEKRNITLNDAYAFAAYLLSIDKPDDAAYVLERLIEANPNARLRYSLANTYFRAGRTDEADKIVSELMVEAWRYPELVTSFAWHRASTNKYILDTLCIRLN